MKKKIIIIVIILILILGIVLGSIFLKNKEERTWVKTYLDYVEDIHNVEGAKMFLAESKIYDNPLLVSYNKSESSFGINLIIKIYAIKNNKVTNPLNLSFGMSEDSNNDIKFMYDIEHDEYNYYYYSESDGIYTYKTIDSLIIENETERKIYSEVATKEEIEKCDQELANNPKYIEYTYSINPKSNIYSDKTFVIDTGMKIKTFAYKKDSKYLEEQIKKLADNYQKSKELGKKYAKEITKQLEKIKEKEENKDKEKTENNSNNNSFKVGTYTLQYGKYKACFNSTDCREFTLNSDGTAIFDGTNKYFRVENYNFGQGVDDNYYPAIIFSDTKDGNAGPNVYTPYVSTPDCLMTDGELECVTYVG